MSKKNHCVATSSKTGKRCKNFKTVREKSDFCYIHYKIKRMNKLNDALNSISIFHDSFYSKSEYPEKNSCCICGLDCNPGSQTCGRCARMLTFVQ